MTVADLDERRIRGAVRLGVERGRMPATAEAESVESLLGKWSLMRDGKVLNGAVALEEIETAMKICLPAGR